MVERVDRLLRGQEAPPVIPLPAVVAADGWTATMLATGEGESSLFNGPYGGGAAGWISTWGPMQELGEAARRLHDRDQVVC